MLTSPGMALAPEQVAQHAAAGKRALEVALVDAAHQPQIGLTHGLRQVINGALARPPPAQPAVPPAVGVPRRSSACAWQPRLAERALQKIVLPGKLPDLRMQRLQVHGSAPCLQPSSGLH